MRIPTHSLYTRRSYQPFSYSLRTVLGVTYNPSLLSCPVYSNVYKLSTYPGQFIPSFCTQKSREKQLLLLLNPNSHSNHKLVYAYNAIFLDLVSVGCCGVHAYE